MSVSVPNFYFRPKPMSAIPHWIFLSAIPFSTKPSSPFISIYLQRTDVHTCGTSLQTSLLFLRVTYPNFMNVNRKTVNSKTASSDGRLYNDNYNTRYLCYSFVIAILFSKLWKRIGQSNFNNFDNFFFSLQIFWPF